MQGRFCLKGPLLILLISPRYLLKIWAEFSLGVLGCTTHLLNDGDTAALTARAQVIRSWCGAPPSETLNLRPLVSVKTSGPRHRKGPSRRYHYGAEDRPRLRAIV